MSATTTAARPSYSRVDATRAKGYSTGLFPGIPAKRKGDTLTYCQAMQRKLVVNLGKLTWSEVSPAGKMAGKLTPAGLANLNRALARLG